MDQEEGGTVNFQIGQFARFFWIVENFDIEPR